MVGPGVDERAAKARRSVNDATVCGGFRMGTQGPQHRNRRRDPVALLDPEVLSVHEVRLAIRLRREDREDREEIGRIADVHRLACEITASDPHAIRGHIHPRAERLQEVGDPTIALGRAHVEAFDGHVSARDRGRDQRERRGREVPGNLQVRRPVCPPAGDKVRALVHYDVHAERTDHLPGHLDIRLRAPGGKDSDFGPIPCERTGDKKTREKLGADGAGQRDTATT